MLFSLEESDSASLKEEAPGIEMITVVFQESGDEDKSLVYGDHLRIRHLEKST